jgi:hypothetical protein
MVLLLPRQAVVVAGWAGLVLLDVSPAQRYPRGRSDGRADVTAENSARKQRGKPFPKGHSGNPQGKPRGARNRVLAALDQIGDEAAKDVLQAAVTAARGGDLRAAELILARVWPARKDRPVMLDLPAMRTAGDLAAALGAVAGAVASGTIAPAEGQAVAAVLESQRRAIETVELERRIAALEAGERR